MKVLATAITEEKEIKGIQTGKEVKLKAPIKVAEQWDVEITSSHKYIKNTSTQSSLCGSAEMNLINVHEDTSLIPGLTHWVKNLALP